MKISIVGYGKMGKSIEKIAKIRNHKILSCNNKIFSYNDFYKKPDVVIEFSHPKSVFRHIKICLENRIPIVSGTTGWTDKLSIIKKMCKNYNGTFLYSSNFSIGMNIFCKITNILSKLLYPYSKKYKVEIEEIHHKEKVDKPSGTSITLAKEIINNNMKKLWTMNKNNNDNILIISKRLNKIVGEHTVKFSSEIEDINIKHVANNRNGFSLGAITAAEWIIFNKKTGYHTMKDVLNL